MNVPPSTAATLAHIEAYQERHIPQVKAFNRRLAAATDLPLFPESNIPSWLPPAEGLKLYQEFFVAADDEAVRGGYLLKHQDFLIHGELVSIAAYQFPLSEGVIDPKLMHVGVLMTLDALRRQPKLFVLGMGGPGEKFPRLLKSMGWSFCEVPFYFKVLNPFCFFKKTTFLRRSFLKRLAMDFAALTGIGWLGIKILQAIKTKRFKGWNLRFEECEMFDHQVDFLWNRVKQEYPMIAVRDAQTLRLLYPQTSPQFKKINIFEGQKHIGWAVVLDTQMVDHTHFGSMRVGSIIDCLSHPEDAVKTVKAASDYLSSCGVDIMVSNHSHKNYRKAFAQSGFLQGPSNFLFTASKDLSKVIGSLDALQNQIYFMRGDGDGPINL